MSRPEVPLQPSATLTVIGADRLPTAHDRALVVAAQALLLQDPHFQALKTPVLDRCEINAGLAETSPGYPYLCYQVPDAVPQEFWAHWGRKDKVNWKSGQVTVRAAGWSETP